MREYVVLARRAGNQWHIGAMTDGHPRTMQVPLTFLPPGHFEATIWEDDEAAQHGVSYRKVKVTPADEVGAALVAAGGAYIRLDPR